MNNVGLVDGIFWVPQVAGGSGFIISRYIPRVTSLIGVYYLCLKRSPSGIIFVPLTLLVGMSDSGT